MKAKLHDLVGYPLCATAHKILEFKGVDYALASDEPQGEESYPARLLTMPYTVLIMPDGQELHTLSGLCARLDKDHPNPPLLPPGFRAVHLMLADYFDTELARTALELVIPDLVEFYSSAGEDRFEIFRRTVRGRFRLEMYEEPTKASAAARERMAEILGELDQDLQDRAFLLGRIGLADFALYGVLATLSFGSGAPLIEAAPHVTAYLQRIERISSRLENP